MFLNVCHMPSCQDKSRQRKHHTSLGLACETRQRPGAPLKKIKKEPTDQIWFMLELFFSLQVISPTSVWVSSPRCEGVGRLLDLTLLGWANSDVLHMAIPEHGASGCL